MKVGSRHHCRLCGQLFCSACTGLYHVPVRFMQKGKVGAARVCYSCLEATLARRRVYEEKLSGNATSMFSAWRQQHRGPMVSDEPGQKIYLPEWQPKGTFPDCFKCHRSFRKGHQHNCRGCGRLMCSNCSSKMNVLALFRKKGKTGPVRVCDMCRFAVFSGADFVEAPIPDDTLKYYAAVTPRPRGAVGKTIEHVDDSTTDSKTTDITEAVPPLRRQFSNQRRSIIEVAPQPSSPVSGVSNSSIRNQNTTVELDFVQTCGMPDCNNPRASRGFCAEHSDDSDLYQSDQVDESRFFSRYHMGQQASRVSNVGLPYNVKHRTHVGKNLEWKGSHLEEMFEMREVIGSGAFGDVYRAVHSTAGFEVAIKMMPADQTEDVKYFQDEIKIIQQCSHQNIVNYYGCFGPDSQNRLWIMMDLCHVGAVTGLNELTRTQMTEAQLAFILGSVLNALVYLHAKGILHRDIKGGNILITKEGLVKLSDFGVSKQIAPPSEQPDGKEKNMQEIEVVGSPHWMPPEILEGRAHKPACDIWSLGITAIELAEQLPFGDMSRWRIIRAIRSNDAPQLKEPFWSERFRDFVSQCLQKDASKRPSAAELMNHPFIAVVKNDIENPKQGRALGGLIKRYVYMLQRQDEEPMVSGSFDLLRQEPTPVSTVNMTGVDIDASDGSLDASADAAATSVNNDNADKVDNIEAKRLGRHIPRDSFVGGSMVEFDGNGTDSEPDFGDECDESGTNGSETDEDEPQSQQPQAQPRVQPQAQPEQQNHARTGSVLVAGGTDDQQNVDDWLS
jgi:serine/threonine protein kinase